VVKVDRSGLNEHHPIVTKLYAAIDRVLKPIVTAEERRAGAHLIAAPRAVAARDQVGLRALNDLLKSAFEQPGRAAADPSDQPASKQPVRETEFERPPKATPPDAPESPEADSSDDHKQAPQQSQPEPLRFKQSPVRLHPGEKRTVTLLANPTSVPPGTKIEIEADPGLTATLRQTEVPERAAAGSAPCR
jgi:hypothetical protein